MRRMIFQYVVGFMVIFFSFLFSSAISFVASTSLNPEKTSSTSKAISIDLHYRQQLADGDNVCKTRFSIRQRIRSKTLLSASSSSLINLPSLHKTTLKLPEPRNWVDQVTFSWANDLLQKGNEKILELKDLWKLNPKDQTMTQTNQFHEIFEKEQIKAQRKQLKPVDFANKKRNILQHYWRSPLSKTIVKM